MFFNGISCHFEANFVFLLMFYFFAWTFCVGIWIKFRFNFKTSTLVRALSLWSAVPLAMVLIILSSTSGWSSRSTTASLVERTWPERRRTEFTLRRSEQRKRLKFFHIFVFSLDLSFQIVLDWGFTWVVGVKKSECCMEGVNKFGIF